MGKRRTPARTRARRWWGVRQPWGNSRHRCVCPSLVGCPGAVANPRPLAAAPARRKRTGLVCVDPHEGRLVDTREFRPHKPRGPPSHRDHTRVHLPAKARRIGRRRERVVAHGRVLAVPAARVALHHGRHVEVRERSEHAQQRPRVQHDDIGVHHEHLLRQHARLPAVQQRSNLEAAHRPWSNIAHPRELQQVDTHNVAERAVEPVVRQIRVQHGPQRPATATPKAMRA
eukprot:640187-Prymnesium_polylepis.1